MSLRQTVIDNLKRIHECSGLKKTYVAHKIGMTQIAFSRYFSSMTPPLEKIEKLAEIYNVDWLEFFLPCDFEEFSENIDENIKSDIV